MQLNDIIDKKMTKHQIVSNEIYSLKGDSNELGSTQNPINA